VAVLFVLVRNGDGRPVPGELARPKQGEAMPVAASALAASQPSCALAGLSLSQFAAAWHAAYGFWGYAGLGRERSPTRILQQLDNAVATGRNGCPGAVNSFASTGVRAAW